MKRLDRPPCSGGLSKAEFLERVRRSNQACQQGEYALAVHLYSEALTADPQNCILYSNRSAAYLRLGQYSTALDDAIKARLINPKWPKVRGLTPVTPAAHSLSPDETVMRILQQRVGGWILCGRRVDVYINWMVRWMYGAGLHSPASPNHLTNGIFMYMWSSGNAANHKPF